MGSYRTQSIYFRQKHAHFQLHWFGLLFPILHDHSTECLQLELVKEECGHHPEVSHLWYTSLKRA